MKTAFNMIKNILLIFLILALIVLACITIVPRLIGWDVFTVQSGSMEPEYPVGSIIYVKEIPTTEIKVNDDISFVLDESLTVVTHRVVRIDESGEFFYTKGIANEVEDKSPVYYKNIIGKPMYIIPYLGYVANFINTGYGKIVMVAAILVILIIAFIPTGKSKKGKKDGGVPIAKNE